VGTVQRREREREELRRKILDAARELFAREGYERVTMRAIAQAIEYSPTAIYHHFEDKDDLVMALCEDDFGRLLGALRATPPPEDAVERVRQLGRAYARFALEHPNHYRFMFMTPNKLEKPREVHSPGQQAFGLVRSAVADALERGQLQARDATTAAQVLWSGLHGAVSLLITLRPEHWPDAPASPDLIDQVIEHGIRGYLPPKPAR